MTAGSSSVSPAATRRMRDDQLAAADLLQDVAGGAGHDRLEQRLVVGERGQHQAGQLGPSASGPPGTPRRRPVGEAHVEHRHVGSVGGIRASASCGRAGLADDLDVVLRLRAARARRVGRPRGRRAGRRGSSRAHHRRLASWLRRSWAGVPSGRVAPDLRAPRGPQSTPATARRGAGRSAPSSISPTRPPTDRRGGRRAGRCPLRRPGCPRRERAPTCPSSSPSGIDDEARAAHRRPARGPRDPRPAHPRRRTPPAARPQASTPTASASRPTTPR